MEPMLFLNFCSQGHIMKWKCRQAMTRVQAFPPPRLCSLLTVRLYKNTTFIQGFLFSFEFIPDKENLLGEEYEKEGLLGLQQGPDDRCS